MQTAKANSKSKQSGKSAVRTPAVSEAVAAQAQDPVAAGSPDMKPAEPQATDIGAVNPVAETSPAEQPAAHPETDVRLLDLNKIVNSTYNPRKNFREDTLLELAESIKQSGVLQPICVRPRDEGFEIVSHPATLDSHMHSFPWEQMMDAAVAMGYRSHQATTCGLHVHISRDAFGRTEQAQEAAIARLLYFVEKFWAELLRFSRRTQSQMNRWAARYGIRLTPFEQMNHAKNSCAGRYTAVNLMNSDTVEIRMFRGTLKLNTLKATLQMVNHLVEVAVSLSDTAVQELSWFDFLDDINEPELIQYLKERRLYVNEPVSASEEE